MFFRGDDLRGPHRTRPEDREGDAFPVLDLFLNERLQGRGVHRLIQRGVEPLLNERCGEGCRLLEFSFPVADGDFGFNEPAVAV